MVKNSTNVCGKGRRALWTPPPPQQSGVGVITPTPVLKVGKYGLLDSVSDANLTSDFLYSAPT